MSEHNAFNEFKFALGQRVAHQVDGLEGIVVQRKLVQNQRGDTTHCYTLSYGPEAYSDAGEIELEAAEEEGDD